jgi:hypothetical protein
MAAARRHRLARALDRHASGNRPKSGAFIAELVEQVKAAAAQTMALHGEDVDFAALQFEVSLEVEHLRLCKRRVAGLEQRIEQAYPAVYPSDALRFHSWHRVDVGDFGGRRPGQRRTLPQ